MPALPVSWAGGRMTERIGIPSRAQLKRWEKLTMEKYRRRDGLFLAEGGKIVGELLRSGRPVEAVLVSEVRPERLGEILAGVPAGMPIFRLTDREWTTLSQDPVPGRGDGGGRRPAARRSCRPACSRNRAAAAPPSGEQSQQPGRPSPDGPLVRLPDGPRQRGLLRGDESQGDPDVDGKPLPPDGDRRPRF